jgi:phenylalanyl-tRNA synthetase beta chain
MTYSMISPQHMDIYHLDKTKAYVISNPLSDEWIYMRPHLLPSVLDVIKNNLNHSPLKLFELSMVYEYRHGDLPLEKPMLLVAWTGDAFLEAKGIAESLFDIMGIEFPQDEYRETSHHDAFSIDGPKHYSLGTFGSLGVIQTSLLEKMDIRVPITWMYIQFDTLVSHAKTGKTFTPIPKYPPVFEDLALEVPPKLPVGKIISFIKSVSPRVTGVSLLDIYKNTKTFHVTYQDYDQNLTSEDIHPIRETILSKLKKELHITLKQ